MRRIAILMVWMIMLVGSSALAETATFRYDALNRLTSATYSTGKIDYSYDSAGNMTRVLTSGIPVSYTLTPSAGQGGHMIPAVAQVVSAGSALAFTVTPDTGYHVNTVTVDGVTAALTGGAYTFTNISANHQINVTFALNTYPITVSAASNGSVVCAPNPVTHGSNSTCTIASTSGYHVRDVLVDGNSVGAVDSHTFDNVIGAHVISAEVEVNTHSITATAENGGSINCTPAVVAHGASSTCTIVPSSSRMLKDLIDNGRNVTGSVVNNVYSIGNVTGAHTVLATFKQYCSPHWGVPLSSTAQMHIVGSLRINSVPARVCDEVALFDAGGQMIGRFTVDTEGLYGDMVVYGDASTTLQVDEGAPAGGYLTPKVWDSVNQTEYSGSSVLLTAPSTDAPPYYRYQAPLLFEAEKFVYADIEVLPVRDIQLRAGWNLFGWPTDLGYYEGAVPLASEFASGGELIPVPSLSDAFSAIGLGSEDYLVAVGPYGKVYVPGSVFNTLKSLLPGNSYWIYVEEEMTIGLPGVLLDPSATLLLPAGWIQTGYWGAEDLSPDDAFSCIDSLFDVIVNGQASVYVPGSPWNTLNLFGRSDGYFIHMISPGVLRFDCP